VPVPAVPVVGPRRSAGGLDAERGGSFTHFNSVKGDRHLVFAHPKKSAGPDHDGLDLAALIDD